MNFQQNKGEIIIYQTEDGQTSLEVKLIEETVWLNLNQMAELFKRDKSVISRHISNIFKTGELSKEATVAKYATIQMEGVCAKSAQVARMREATPQATPQALSDVELRILRFCHEERSASEIINFTGMNPDYIRKELVHKLIEKGLLALTIPDKPRSPYQKYILTEVGAKHGKIYE